MASKVSVGKTAPVPLGQQPAANSLPVVFAEDQQPIPVEEQNLVKSEVALSLLGIPRSEVALGIFADVNTYDVNPTEWATIPLDPTLNSNGVATDGVEHIPEEAGARLVSSNGNTTILTSKRFFRYQPGRVSASTMGVKMNLTGTETDAMKGAPSIKKWGIFDKFDGYYFEVANSGVENNFRCVRRTQAVIPQEPAGYGTTGGWLGNPLAGSADTTFHTNTNFGEVGVDPVIIRDGLIYVAAAINDPSLVYSPSDVRAIDNASSPENELKNKNFNSDYAVRLAYDDGTDWQEHMENRKHMFPFDQDTVESLTPEDTSVSRGYIRADAHCNFYQIISNFNRKGSNNTFPQDFTGLQGVSDFWDSSGNYAYTNGNYWETGAQSTLTNNSKKKIWHLLVNIQGAGPSAGGTSGTRISSGEFTNSNNALPANVRSRTDGAQRGNVTLKEWYNLCVPKPYRMVYEWRPVRAMFSGDKLDGQTRVVRQSDINTAATDSFTGSGDGINRPGEQIDLANGTPFETTSAYNIDFTKVTMWKTEFSWYGAVGALFLCYVPIENGEARWVRVHHIRASNQHAVASLGNATLPITYLVHGSPMGTQPTEGNSLVKYGASYYIDGGDKGTVRLLSKASDYRREVAPGFVNLLGGATLANGGYTRSGSEAFLTIKAGSGMTDVDARYGFDKDTAIGLMGAYIEGDITSKVKWMIQDSNGDIKLYFENGIPGSSNTANIKLIVPRAQQSLMSLRAKDFIVNREGQGVRNRLQIYPIKLGAGCSGGTTGDVLNLRTVKNPLKIVSNVGSLGTTHIYGGSGATATVKEVGGTNDVVNTGRSTAAVEVEWNTGTNPGAYLADGKYTYGYFLGTTSESQSIPTNGVFTDTDITQTSWFPVLGRLYREGSDYYFSKYYSYPEEVRIAGAFLPERHLKVTEYPATYANTGWEMFTEIANSTLQTHTGYGDQTKWDKLDTSNTSSFVTWEEITRLSGVRIGQDLKLTPVTNTGVEVLSYYANAGGYQFDLQDYFAYNKEYLSFPLTDEVDIINVYGHYNINSEPTLTNINPFYVNTAVTWEEQ
jgi:hypothetical protein